MSYDKILSDLFNSIELDECITKMVREDLRKDFKQELFVILLATDKKKIEEIEGKGELKYYAVRLIINLATQTRNVFHKKFINNNHELTGLEIKDEPADLEKEYRFTNAIEKLNKLEEYFGTFYYKALVELMKKHKSVREISRVTGIPNSTLSSSIQLIRKYLNDE